MDFEAQLAQYRAKKRKEAPVVKTKDKFLGLFGFSNMNIDIPDDKPLIKGGSSSSSYNEMDDVELESSSLFTNSYRTYAIFFCIIVWTIIFAFFVKLQWGAVFFIISALIFVYYNTRTGPRKAGEVSAYSVFNKDCQVINGTLTAEQFEKELRFGPGSVN